MPAMVQRQELQKDSTLKDLTYKRAHWERGPFMFTNGLRHPPAPGRYRLFVYGTLKTGFGNNRLLQTQGSQFLCNSTLKGYIMFSCGGFPAIVKAPHPDWKVTGELYDIEQAQLDACDRLEGVKNNFYQRVEVDLQDGDGKAFTYIQPAERFMRDGTAFLPSGTWKIDNPRFLWKEGTEVGAILLASEMPKKEPRPEISGYPHYRTNPMAQNRQLVGPVVVNAPVKTPEVKTISPELQVGPGWEEASDESEVA